MKTVTVATIQKEVVTAITCDKCGKTESRDVGMGFSEEWHCFGGTGGYGSPFGDMVRWRLDLCEGCFFAIVKDHVRHPYPDETD